MLDEPTSSLGRDDVTHLFALIRRLKAKGHAVVYISHFIEEVREVCDRIVVLRDGRCVGSGHGTMSPEEIVRLMVGRDIGELYPERRAPRVKRSFRSIGSNQAARASPCTAARSLESPG